jgi:hypothetical protein
MGIPETLFFVAFATVAGWFLYRFVRHGGLRGVLYGSAVSRTVGEVEVAHYGSTRTILRVHVLEDGRIVLEQSTRALLAASMNGHPLTADQADRLIFLLQQART